MHDNALLQLGEAVLLQLGEAALLQLRESRQQPLLQNVSVNKWRQSSHSSGFCR